MTFQVALDITIACLLLVFIGYAFALSRQLRELRNNRDEMARTIASFNEATARAEAGIPRLRKTAEDAGKTLGDAVSRARALRDDLAFMSERAEALVPRLEGAVSDARARQPDAPRESVATASSSTAAGSHWLDEDDLVPIQETPAPSPRTAAPAVPLTSDRTFSVRTPAPGVARPPSGAPRKPGSPLLKPETPAPGLSWPETPTKGKTLSAAEKDRSLSELELLRAIRAPQR